VSVTPLFKLKANCTKIVSFDEFFMLVVLAPFEGMSLAILDKIRLCCKSLHNAKTPAVYSKVLYTTLASGSSPVVEHSRVHVQPLPTAPGPNVIKLFTNVNYECS
jgi:hypothetical protein